MGALALIDAGKMRTIEGCAQNPETEYLLFKEQGTGFMNKLMGSISVYSLTLRPRSRATS